MNDEQLLQQNLHILDARKQQLESEQLQIDAALQSLTSTPESYEYIGNILVKKDPQTLTSQLKTQRESVLAQLKRINEQTEQLLQRKTERTQ